MQALWFTALINVNLAIINLLPIIILDGGHITLALFEIVSGRKLPKRLITAMANLVAVFLIGLMIILTFKDVLLYRRLDKLKQQMAAEQQATPTPVPAATDLPVEPLPEAP
jgi:regulator of sigma E protease